MSLTVMVVDDDLGFLTLIDAMLKRAGYEVLKARDGYAALEMLDDVTPDLFILDVMMPVMDGIDLCSQIRARPPTSETPLIFLTAKGDVESSQKAFQAGANAFVTKPILLDDLLEAVRKVSVGGEGTSDAG